MRVVRVWHTSNVACCQKAEYYNNDELTPELQHCLALRRPFGTYLLHTSTGSLLCHDPKEVLQMLYITMVTQSGEVSTRAHDAVEEHRKDRYQVGINRYTV